MKTHNQFVKELKQINKNIKVIGTYTRAIDNIEVECLECGNKWSPKAYSLLQGKGCPKCRTRHGVLNNNGLTHKKTIEEFNKQLKKIDSSIEITGEYLNTHTFIECHCLRCNNVWKAKPYSLLKGHGCPRCSKSGTSFMEQFIKTSFEKATNYKVLSRDKSAIGMELDIYIPKLNFAVEPGNWFLHKKYLQRDKIKREKCEEKNIRLITIYDKYPVNEKAPFKNNCITFSDDYNKANHKEIVNLVYRLFEINNIDIVFSDREIKLIEEIAYKNAKSMTDVEFKKRMSTIQPNIEVIGKYVNSNKRIKVKCKNCGFEWDGVPSNMLAGNGCKKCGTKRAHEKFKKSQNDFILEVQKENPNVEILGKYISRHKPVLARCRICGFEWSPKASSLLRGSSHKGSITIHKNIQK